MKDVQFVNSSEVKTIEQYGAALLVGLISLKTLGGFHVTALNRGLLDEDEMESAKTILWEIERLHNLYRVQMQHVLDRTNLSEDEVLASFRSTLPNVKVPRKRKKKDDL